MAFPHCFFTFFLLFLSFCYLGASTISRPQTVVDIRNDLPNNIQVQLALGDEQASFYLKPGHHHNQTLAKDQDFKCTAMWSRWFTTWDVYDAKRDKGHHTIYWSVKRDGFYHSWDGSKWKLVEYWYTD